MIKGIRCNPYKRNGEECFVRLGGADFEVPNSYVHKVDNNGSSFYYINCLSVRDFKHCSEMENKLVCLELGKRTLMLAVSEEDIVDLS